MNFWISFGAWWLDLLRAGLCILLWCQKKTWYSFIQLWVESLATLIWYWSQRDVWNLNFLRNELKNSPRLLLIKENCQLLSFHYTVFCLYKFCYIIWHCWKFAYEFVSSVIAQISDHREIVVSTFGVKILCVIVLFFLLSSIFVRSFVMDL